VFSRICRAAGTSVQAEMGTADGYLASSYGSVKTTEFVTLTVTHFVEQPLKVLHSFAFWN
jgi:hypothetical protein